MIDSKQITAMILAGGQGSRMGGRDKGLVELGGRPMIRHVITALAPQAGTLIVNANRNLADYQALGYPVIRDELDGFQGPLAGILAALDVIHTPYLLCAPCDAPGLPLDLGRRLGAALQDQQGELAVVHDGENLQPAFALIPVALRHDLQEYLLRGERKLRSWCKAHRLALADYSDQPQAFANINNAAELRRFEDKGDQPIP
ncbi:molybdenum cofactor guanylyltransferase MobA [Thiolapillus sp.]